ncbi:hypothetical protein Nepgr_015067 [Nepenthes gracilis]|uniref:UPF1 domain-containing protein n=1 Tax=Nepenthes gracilis TaxID=150966 RepID=A0AAD3SMZ5_NEPGR|nr:hypothetical protein Nepgr_015067 [Nepenthes gracilis]
MYPTSNRHGLVGLQYLAGDITGDDNRCVAMLQAFKEATKDYSTPPEKILSRDLTARISSYVSFLIECRPLSFVLLTYGSSSIEDNELRLVPGDELRLQYSGDTAHPAWMSVGHVIKLTAQEEVALELRASQGASVLILFGRVRVLIGCKLQ